jgi:membrane associated rhomboid family serine protease
MTPTPVGMRCPECSKQTTQVRTLRSLNSTTTNVTIGLIIVNAILFLASGRFALGSGGGASQLYLNLGLFGPSVADGEVWRLVTSGFLHSGLLHVGFNMYLLYMLGQMLEPELGPRRFALLYVTALLAGSAGALALEPEALTVGASGAVFGLMGAAFVELRSRGVDPFQTFIGPLILLNLVISFVIPNISIGGHIGGLIGGAIAGLVLIGLDRRRLPGWAAYPALVALSVVFAGAALFFAAASA